MSTTSFPWSQLPRETLVSLLEPGTVPDPHLRLLRWLVWLPLLSACELARLMGRDEKTVAGHLVHMETRSLVAHVVLHEPGWPRHYRYHATDAGLYVLSARYGEPLSVPRLVQSYPVDRDELYARLARPYAHLVLSDLVSRLVAEGRRLGYPLSYQQPWQETYSERGAAHRFTTDAACLIGGESGTQYAFYVRVDAPGRTAGDKLDRAFLARLLDLRLASRLQGCEPPQLLLLAPRARFPFWSDLLLHCCEARNTRLPAGSIADPRRFCEGVYSAIWLPLQALVDGQRDDVGAVVALSEQFTTPACPQIAERITQSLTFQAAFAEHPAAVLPRSTGRLPRFVGDSLQEEAEQLTTEQLTDLLHGTKADGRAAAALFALALSAGQKALLEHLAHHPLLSLPDLLVHLYPQGGAERLVQRLLLPIQQPLQLVNRCLWDEGSTWRERERYHLSELGLRFLAARHAVPVTHYLTPILVKGQPRRPISASDPALRWRQRGVWEFKMHMAHTHGLYRCMQAVLSMAHRSGVYQVLAWKNPREAYRSYFHPTKHTWMPIWPDAELLLATPGGVGPLPVLIEYDRGTTFDREYGAKFEAYADFQRLTRTRLPPILFLMRRPQAETVVRNAIGTRHAAAVRVVFMQETQLLQHGLVPVLTCLG